MQYTYSKAQAVIINLLGIPQSESDSEFDYYLGMAKHGIDTGHLTIYFDQNKKVSRINFIEDNKNAVF